MTTSVFPMQYHKRAVRGVALLTQQLKPFDTEKNHVFRMISTVPSGQLRMITGKQTLVSIDQVVGEARSKIYTVEAQIDGLNQKLVDHQRGQIEDYKELARVHLDVLADGELMQHLDWTDQQVMALLRKRATVLEELQVQIQATEAPLQGLEIERTTQALQVDAAAEIVDAA